MWSAAAIGREQHHYLLHLLSAAGLLWLALQSRHAAHPPPYIPASTAQLSDASSLAQPVQPAPPSQLELCACNATSLQLPTDAQQLSADAPCAPPTQQPDAGTSAPQFPATALQEAAEGLGAAQPRVIMFYHVATLNIWREVRSPPHRVPGVCHV